MLSARVVGLIASGVLALAAVGCSSSPSPAKPPASSPVSSPASSAGGHTYPAAGDLCAKVDQASLTARLGKLVDSKAGAVTPGGPVTQQTCSYRFGEPTARIPVEVSVQMATNGGSVADYYQGLRGVAQSNGAVTPVAGLGQGAYRYTNGIGPHLVTYDGNLYLSYAVITGALPPGKVPAGIDAAEVASARGTMAALAQ